MKALTLDRFSNAAARAKDTVRCSVNFNRLWNLADNTMEFDLLEHILYFHAVSHQDRLDCRRMQPMRCENSRA